MRGGTKIREEKEGRRRAQNCDRREKVGTRNEENVLRKGEKVKKVEGVVFIP